MLLVRDVTELRRRDRLLLSKDATIREIHHRVKNNLQTISSLLRLQAPPADVTRRRRPRSNESVRRIRTIALVHETLSREAGDDVAFVEIVRPAAAPGRGEPAVAGPAGPLPGRGRRRQAAGDRRHAAVGRAHRAAAERRRSRLPGGQRRRRRRRCCCDNDGSELRVEVVDDGLGVPAGFDLDKATGLGLSIVRTLVTTELAGTIEMRAATDDDSPPPASTPVRGTGTVVDLRVPTIVDAGGPNGSLRWRRGRSLVAPSPAGRPRLVAVRRGSARLATAAGRRCSDGHGAWAAACRVARVASAERRGAHGLPGRRRRAPSD